MIKVEVSVISPSLRLGIIKVDGKCYQPQPSARLITLNVDLDYSGYHKIVYKHTRARLHTRARVPQKVSNSRET